MLRFGHAHRDVERERVACAPRLRSRLEARQPDIVGLQELKVSEEEFPASAFGDLGFELVVYGQKAWNGVAILTRHRAEPTLRGLPGQEDFGARLVGARIAGLTFATVYCPNGKDLAHEDYPRKLAWFDDLAKFWPSRVGEGETSILCGDFNVVPAPIDSWHGEGGDGTLFHTPEERSRFGALLDLGLRDLYRERNPDTQAFSWWDYRAGAFPRGRGLRIDFLLGSDAVLDRVTNVEIDRDFRKKKEGLTASDHAPVFADLDWDAS